MPYFELLARDYSEWLGNAGQEPFFSPADASPSALDAATCAVLETALFDIEQGGVFSAVCASLTGVMLESRSDLSLAHLATYAPPHDDSYPALKRRLIETAAPAAIVVALETHHARLSFAQRLTEASILSEQRGTRPEREEIEKLNDAWCRVCTAALKASSAVRQSLARAGHRLVDMPFDGKAAVLESAAAGSNPCVDTAGQITVPGWAEKRNAPRFGCHAPASADCDGRVFEVTIVDASASGLGIKGMPEGSRSRCPIMLTLAAGEMLSGKIVWCRNGAAGVALDFDLPGDHALLRRARS